jgi:hypothetical protein
MTLRVFTFQSSTLGECRWVITVKELPKPIVIRRVFDTFTLALASLAPMAEFKRQSAIGRFYCSDTQDVRFLLVFKAPKL